MRASRVLLPIIATAIISVGCAAPYQENSLLRELTFTNLGGYSSKQLSDNRFRVEYMASQHTDYYTVARYVQYRSATLTLEKGYDGFVYEKPVDYLTPPRPRYRLHVGAEIRLVKKPYPSGESIVDAKELEAELKPFIDTRR